MNTTPSTRRHAIVAGVSLLVMAVAAGFAYGYAYAETIGTACPDAIATGIAEHSALFYGGIAGWLVVLACDIVAACALYAYLANADKSLSSIAMVLRLVYALFLAVAVFFLMNASLATDGQARFLVDSFKSTWSLGLILFGAHLFVLGIALMRNRAAPTAISVLILIEAACYVFVHSLRSFLPRYGAFAATAETVLSAPMAAGELSLAVWLVARGGKPPKRKPKTA